jgi:Tc5 transposase DNA-binding domain
MPVTYHEIEDRIIQAVEHVADFPDADIAKTARDFDVPYNQLRYRLKTSNSRISADGQNKKLSPAQELALCHFLDRLDTTGFPARIGFIKSFANDLLRSNYIDPTTDPPSVSHIWPHRFLNRHPEYSTRKLKPLVIE